VLKRLYDYANSHNLDFEPGFKPKTVRWAIACSTRGGHPQVIRLGDAGGKGLEFAKCPDLTQGELKQGGETKSHFLIEKVSVVTLLGVTGDTKADQKSIEKHEYFVDLLRQASVVMPDLAHIANLLSDSVLLEQIRQQLAEQKAKPTDDITVLVDGDFPVESTAWHDWWRAFRAGLLPEKKKQGVPRMRCMITGKLIEPAATHPKIEGLADVGGVSVGSPLVGFNKSAYCSFNLEQSANAAMSIEVASGYRAALNTLIRENGMRLGGAKVVYWFSEKINTDDDPIPWLIEGKTTQEEDAHKQARELLTAICSGEKASLGTNRYYALNLSGASGRVMVRDWMEGQFEELVGNVNSWFEDLSIVRNDGQGLIRTPKFLAILGATVRSLDDLSAPFIARMWRCAIRNEPFPRSALTNALIRWRSCLLSGETPSQYSAALMKAYHVRDSRRGGEPNMITPYLNESHPEGAYHCGRLMAVLAALQRSALGDVGAGVVQRYYASASSTPALVLGRLTRTSQYHLDKLDAGLAYWYEAKLANIWTCLKDNIPSTLTLEEQSLFALGYYQQVADLRTKQKPNDGKGDIINE